jgi:hypothetical protein
MRTQFIWMELTSSRMRVIVKLNLGVTLETYRDGVVNGIAPPTCTGLNVVQLNLYAYLFNNLG